MVRIRPRALTSDTAVVINTRFLTRNAPFRALWATVSHYGLSNQGRQVTQTSSRRRCIRLDF